jgi:hypothetical protein
VGEIAPSPFKALLRGELHDRYNGYATAMSKLDWYAGGRKGAARGEGWPPSRVSGKFSARRRRGRMRRRVGDTVGYTTGIRYGEPVWCAPCAEELYPESLYRGAVRRDEQGMEVSAVLQEERPFTQEEHCANCGAVVIDTAPPLPRREDPDSWVV